jgi:hypothetical protein
MSLYPHREKTGPQKARDVSAKMHVLDEVVRWTPVLAKDKPSIERAEAQIPS